MNIEAATLQGGDSVVMERVSQLSDHMTGTESDSTAAGLRNHTHSSVSPPQLIISQEKPLFFAGKLGRINGTKRGKALTVRWECVVFTDSAEKGLSLLRAFQKKSFQFLTRPIRWRSERFLYNLAFRTGFLGSGILEKYMSYLELTFHLPLCSLHIVAMELQI